MNLVNNQNMTASKNLRDRRELMLKNIHKVEAKNGIVIFLLFASKFENEAICIGKVLFQKHNRLTFKLQSIIMKISMKKNYLKRALFLFKSWTDLLKYSPVLRREIISIESERSMLKDTIRKRNSKKGEGLIVTSKWS
jgi:hypothetical protein